MSNQIIYTNQAPKPIGPYSQAIEVNGIIFISGQIPLDPETGSVVGDSIELQAKQALRNLKAILHSQGLSTKSLTKTTVFIRDLNFFVDFNKVYEQELDGACPARSVVEVSGLPKNVLVEIEAIACR